MSTATLEAVRVENLGPLKPFEPLVVGPVWKTDDDGDFILPEHTLGWDVIAWCAAYLRGADGEDGWIFTLEQARFVLWYYAVDTDGKWLYRDAVIQMVKGWGKDPLGAVISAVEFVGPCRPGGWVDADGEIHEEYAPGRRVKGVQLRNEAWVQLAGVSRENVKNTMSYLQGRFTEEAKKKYGIEVNKQIIYGESATRKIEVITSSPTTIEGNRPSFVIKGEPHHWKKSNDGIEVDAVIDRNVNKMRKMNIKGSRTMSLTNAYNPAEESVGQADRETYEKQAAAGIFETLYCSLEAPEGIPLLPNYTRFEGDDCIREFDAQDVLIPPDRETIIRHLEWVLTPLAGEATWLSPEETAKEILKPDSDLTEMRRFYLNSVESGTEDYLRDGDIKATIHPDMIKLREAGEIGDVLRAGWSLVKPDEPVVMFFDGSKSEDSTALVGCRISDGYLFLIGLWEKPRGERGHTWLAPRGEIDSRVHEAFARLNVVAFWADPSHSKDDADGTRYWDNLIDSWHVKYNEQLQYWAVQGGDRRSSIMWDMTNHANQITFSQEVVRFADEMDSHQIAWDGHPGLRSHLRNARRAMSVGGPSIRKASRNSSRKIDAAVCAVGAKMLARLVLIKGLEVEEKKSQKVWWG